MTPETFDGTYAAFLRCVHPDDRKTLDRKIDDSVKANKPFNAVYRLLFGDGRIKFINAICKTVYDQTGSPIQTVGTFQDITAQIQLETSLRIVEDEKALILDNISEGIVHLSLDRKIKWLNKSAAEMMGSRQADLIGQECQTAWCLLAAECERCPFAQTLKTREITRGIVEDGQGREWRVQTNPVMDPNGELIGIIEMRHPNRS
jgi:PAS domain-containing protein